MRRILSWAGIVLATLTITACSGPGPTSSDTGASPSDSAKSGAPPTADQAAAAEAKPQESTQQEGQVIAQLISETSNAAPATGDWLTARCPVNPKTLNVMLSTADAYSARICSFIFEGFFERDNRTMELKPVVAESYEVSDDHLTYTIKMRKDVTFSDGTPMTANDVKFSYEAIMDPKNDTMDMRNYYQDFDQCEVVDEHTVRFHAKKPYYRHLSIIGDLPIFPKHIYGTGDFNTLPANRAPVGSGPYMFDKWDTNQQIILKRNPNYWDKQRAPHLDQLAWRIMTDDDSSLQVFKRGEIDSIGLTPEQWHQETAAPEFKQKYYTFTSLSRPGYVGGFSYIGWNLRKPLLQDKRVRQALTMLLDRQTILETIFYGLGKVVSGPEFSEGREYDQTIKPWPFDPKRASQLLAEAGWKDTNNDGVLDKDGAKFEFSYMIPDGSHEYEALATVYKEELQRAGINMTIQLREWGSFIDNVQKHEFDAYTMSWAIPFDSDPYQVWHSSQADKGSNYVNFVNPEADKIVEDIRTEFDREKRIPMFHRFHAIIHDEQPYTLLFNAYSLYAMDKRYRNVYLYATGTDPREFWVPQELQRHK